MGLEYRPLPDNLKPMMGGQLIEGGQAYKPTFGSAGTMGVKIFHEKVYNEAKSMLAGQEVFDSEEMVQIDVDKFTKHKIRVRDLDNKQKMDLGGLIKMFRDQKETNETQIVDWLIINEFDRAYLTTQGVYTVEQLAGFDPNDGYRFGGNGKVLIEKARQHVAGKVDTKAAEREAEYKALLEEVAKLRAAQVEKETKAAEAEAEKHLEIAKAEKRGPGRPKAEASEGSNV